MRKLTIAAAGLIAVAATTIVTSRAQARPAGLDDATIVAIFDGANSADIETGALAAERAQNKEVREFGRMLSDVHTAVRQKGRDLAAKLGVTPTAPKGDHSAADHQAVMNRLRALNGAAFDRAFLQHEEAFHAAVLEALNKTLVPAIQNKDLKDFVTSLVPAFEAHRLGAENLQKKVAAN
jgi:putative membrane protein